MFPDVRGVCDCAGSREDFVLAPPFVWSSPFVIGSTPWSFSFTAQYPACPCPCLRFASSLSTGGARLGVRMGHYSFPVRLFHSRHHAGFIPAHNKTILYTDGGCSGNDQPDVSKREMIAVVSDSTGNVLVETQVHGGSNNIAELLAVKEALVWATERGYEAIEIRTDSRNNLAWVAGRIGNKLNDRGAVLDLYMSINRLRERVQVDLVWIPRDVNLAGQHIEAKCGL
jgi:ribonuclease HI